MTVQLCHTLTQSISSTSMSLKDATYLRWLIIMKYVWRNKLYKCWTVHNREREKWPGPSYLPPSTNTGQLNSSLQPIFLWDHNLGSRLWESLKGVSTGSNSFFNCGVVKPISPLTWLLLLLSHHIIEGSVEHLSQCQLTACVKSFVSADTEMPRILPMLFLNIHNLALRMCVLSRVSVHLTVSAVWVDVQQDRNCH